jgi:hypothetical protein
LLPARTVLVILLVCVSILSLLTVTPAAAASGDQLGDCYIYAQNDWAGPEQTSFEDCAYATFQNGSFDSSGYASGYWSGFYLAIDSQGNVFYRAENSSKWVEAGALDIQTDSASDEGSGTAWVPSSPAIYTGSATLTIELVDIYGRSQGTQTYTTNVKVVVGQAKQGESNPFYLQIDPAVMTNALGEFSLRSSLPAEGTLFQYWTYQFQQDGAFKGSLTDNHNAEGIALNLATIPVEIAPNLQMPYLLSLARSTQIAGVFDQNQIQIQVAGNTTDMAHPFKATIRARRTQ